MKNSFWGFAPQPAWHGGPCHPSHRAMTRHGGPWGPPPGFGRRGPRARRGDVRAAILALLAEAPANGYGLIGAIKARSDGAWKPSPGSIYPVLSLLQDEGLVEPVTVEGRPLLTLTDAGRRSAAERADDRAPWDVAAAAADKDEMALVDLLRQVATAATQVAQAGTKDQQDAARDLLVETRRRLYALLAGDERSG